MEQFSSLKGYAQNSQKKPLLGYKSTLEGNVEKPQLRRIMKSQICKSCNGRGKALAYFNGRVLTGFCSCESGKKAEKEADKIMKELGMDVELMRKHRIRLKDRTKF